MIDIDSQWDYNDPAGSEMRLRALIPQAEQSGDPALEAELLTQIARAMGLQMRFDEAHALLDDAQALLTPDMPRAAVRLALERGRLINTAGDPGAAFPHFEWAWGYARDTQQDFYAIDAAHMLAIVTGGRAALDWNAQALDIAVNSSDARARNWAGSLYNNLGWAYHDLGDYNLALQVFLDALQFREVQGEQQAIRIAAWCVGRCLRSLELYDEALTMQTDLLVQYGGSDPNGYTEEEIGECLLALGRGPEARKHFAAAYGVLSHDPWLTASDPARIERLRALSR
ncbi:MAG: tetratricopeptide repeat protein [Chloroflexi bacterium]|nr:tetratricopeptide repeat protein [Chloroflexota bacterium]